MSIKSPKRIYRKTTRAKQEEQTRRRITEAVVELHRTVGPAQTTISDIANLAGVGRVTVYKHFPDDAAMFRACSDHWLADNPPPDFTQALTEPDELKRAAAVFRLLYDYYRRSYDMMGKVMRDAKTMPALADVVENGWMKLLQGLEDALVPAGKKGASAQHYRATLRVAMDINTWSTISGMGIDDETAAELVCRWLKG
ncbi:TetR/AcrR family transcriptional regulator [Marinobacter sp. NP-4(2019)]|uniref:TetR/AcrR family transcriptional regulator n=1 Tax=Marinobacter sp. NP-4(2019) TaxID=2488665 RepID=UPI000FC3E572|nr:TetR/AcrR family transcriptional regulator [Marinobacter sp. NP-4(2019)]AZT83617.1 TetR/AcrR family transcriptional regulator [Marinobacter sp. NP-4(2019)]